MQDVQGRKSIIFYSGFILLLYHTHHLARRLVECQCLVRRECDA